jgi:hypothetical protein
VELVTLASTCSYCPRPLEEGRCADHGAVPALWRTPEATYDDFAEHLVASGPFPTYLPWPLSPGWRVSDFARVEGTRATLSCASGSSDLDGPVDLVVVAEEPGTGLGGRAAGLHRSDPGSELGHGRPAVRVRIGMNVVPLWPVSTSATDDTFDRTVLVGEAEGRWLWLVVRPASAVLLLRDDWILRDVSGVGPPLVELPFGGPAPAW